MISPTGRVAGRLILCKLYSIATDKAGIAVPFFVG